MILLEKMQANEKKESRKSRKKGLGEQPMKKQNIEAVWFDWDRTLVRVVGDVPGHERLAILFQGEGLSFTPAQVADAMAQYQADVAQQKLPFLGDPPQRQQDIMAYYAHLLRNLGLTTIDIALVERLYSGYALLPTTLYDDALPALAALQAQGLALGIVSNHSRSVRPVIEEMVGQYIAPKHVVISQELGVNKPSPRIFREALRRLPVAPERSIFVGDNLEVDAIGAVLKGRFGYGFWLDREDTGAEAAWPLLPNVIRITDLWQLLDWL
jgi:HAD superfamily hydrolase (TIGR01509 family)